MVRLRFKANLKLMLFSACQSKTGAYLALCGNQAIQRQEKRISMDNHSTATGSRLVHIEEAAKALGVSVSGLYRLARNGTVPSARLGKRILFDVDTVINQMLSKKRNQPKPVPAPQLSYAELQRHIVEQEGILIQARRELDKAASAVIAAAQALGVAVHEPAQERTGKA